MNRHPTLHSALLELRPLAESDYDALYSVACDPLIWEQHPVSTRYQQDVFSGFFRESIESGGALVVIDPGSERIIGSSRFHGYDAEQSEVEIGWTFLSRRYWGGLYNRELKRLMIAHALDNVERVVFLVGPKNIRSQRALAKIGAGAAGTRVDGNGRESLLFEIRR